MDAVRRASDDELCGHESRQDAVDQVLAEGLASLAERWTMRHRETDEEQVVCIVEANPAEVTVGLGYYSLPGVPTMTIAAKQIASGEWKLGRRG